MSDPNWTSPSGPGAEPGAQPVPQQYVYAAIDPNHNWGVAVPQVPGYAILVHRPPRPPIVQLATILAFVGVAISLALEISNAVYQWSHRMQIVDAVAGEEPLPADMRDSVAASAMIGLVVGGVFWLLVAAGVVICTILTVRKKNAARIVLASVMGVLGLYQLCQVGSGAVVLAFSNRLADSTANSPFSASLAAAEVTWWSMVGQGLLAVIALIVFVSLIIPPSNRYFSPGPGHRFAPEV